MQTASNCTKRPKLHTFKPAPTYGQRSLQPMRSVCQAERGGGMPAEIRGGGAVASVHRARRVAAIRAPAEDRRERIGHRD